MNCENRVKVYAFSLKSTEDEGFQVRTLLTAIIARVQLEAWERCTVSSSIGPYHTQTRLLKKKYFFFHIECGHIMYTALEYVWQKLRIRFGKWFHQCLIKITSIQRQGKVIFVTGLHTREAQKEPRNNRGKRSACQRRITHMEQHI
jgi:hypothetical protein